MGPPLRRDQRARVRCRSTKSWLTRLHQQGGSFAERSPAVASTSPCNFANEGYPAKRVGCFTPGRHVQILETKTVGCSSFLITFPVTRDPEVIGGNGHPAQDFPRGRIKSAS